jgi:hypothetical protein
MLCIVRIWLQVLAWEIESMIIHDFVDELGVVDESRDYVPPNVLLVADTQFDPSAIIVVTNVEAQQAILDDILNKNQGRNS